MSCPPIDSSTAEAISAAAGLEAGSGAPQPARNAAALEIDGRHAADAAAPRSKLIEGGEPADILDWLTYLAGTGEVNLYGWRLAATFGVDESDLIRKPPESSASFDVTPGARPRRVRPATVDRSADAGTVDPERGKGYAVSRIVLRVAQVVGVLVLAGIAVG